MLQDSVGAEAMLSFNSNMVRLDVECERGKINDFASFNSNMVRLDETLLVVLLKCSRRFNSNMVRLDVQPGSCS